MIEKSEKQKRKSEAVSAGQHKRWGSWENREVTNDHSYSSKVEPDIAHVVQEEIVDTNGENLTLGLHDGEMADDLLSWEYLVMDFQVARSVDYPFLLIIPSKLPHMDWL